MTTSPDPDVEPPGSDDEFLAQARSEDPGLLAEVVAFLRENRKWWLTPIVIALLIIGTLIVLGTSTAGPFVYTLF